MIAIQSCVIPFHVQDDRKEIPISMTKIPPLQLFVEGEITHLI